MKLGNDILLLRLLRIILQPSPILSIFFHEPLHLVVVVPKRSRVALLHDELLTLKDCLFELCLLHLEFFNSLPLGLSLLLFLLLFLCL